MGASTSSSRATSGQAALVRAGARAAGAGPDSVYGESLDHAVPASRSALRGRDRRDRGTRSGSGSRSASLCSPFAAAQLPCRRMLIVAGVLIGVVLVVIVGQDPRTMQGTRSLPITAAAGRFRRRSGCGPASSRASRRCSRRSPRSCRDRLTWGDSSGQRSARGARHAERSTSPLICAMMRIYEHKSAIGIARPRGGPLPRRHRRRPREAGRQRGRHERGGTRRLPPPGTCR